LAANNFLSRAGREERKARETLVALGAGACGAPVL
jgi:hypothetical protein